MPVDVKIFMIVNGKTISRKVGEKAIFKNGNINKVNFKNNLFQGEGKMDFW